MSRTGWSSQVPKDANGAVPINIQERVSLPLDLNFIQAQGAPTTLAADADPDDLTLTLTDDTGFVDGNIIAIFSGDGSFFFAEQIGAAAASVITIDTPVDKAFSAGATVLRAINNMAVDGSVTPQIFQIGPIGSDIEIDITRVMGYIQDASAMDDSRFGGIAALTNGIVFRKSNGDNQNFWNAKTNGKLALITFGLTYTDSAPAGSFGARFRNSYNGEEKHGVAIRLSADETLEILIQDDLTGLEVFNMMAQGHVRPV